MPLKRERSSLQCLVSHLQDSVAMGALPLEILQQIGSHLTTKERACCFPVVCKAFSEACDPQAVGNLWSSLALSASTLSSTGDVPYEHRLTWVGARIKQAHSVELTFDGGPLSRQSLEDLAEILTLSLRLRRLTLYDILPSMIFVTSGVSALEELDLVDICGKAGHLGKPLQALSGLIKLRRLSISMSDGACMDAWPDWSRLSHLESITLRGSSGYMFPWAPLPAWFAGLSKLQSLDISYAGYKELPEAIAGLTQLTCLKLENNCFRNSPVQGQSFRSHASRLVPLLRLRTLSLGSWVGAIPAALRTMTDLETLHIRGELPYDEDDDQAFQVEGQHLIEQKAVLPAQCNHLTALHTLRLDCFSEMKSFPQQIIQLTSLHILDLSNTCLSALPPTLAALASLQELLLGACCFRRVPAALLRQLESLQVLDMSRNTELEMEGLSVDDLTWLAQGLRVVRVDKLQNRAWSRASLPALAFLEEVAAGHQEHQQQTAAPGMQQLQGGDDACIAPHMPQTLPRQAQEVRAIWEREAWLKRGQRRLVMRLSTVKMAPVRLDDYLSDDLRELARKCVAGAEPLPDN